MTIPGTNTIADISHWSGKVDLARAKASGLTGLFQKATQGLRYVDPTLRTNTAAAQELEIPFGTYHFGIKGDGSQQAAFYLQTVAGINGILVLDWEANNTPATSMSLAQAEDFVAVVQDATGVWPGLYCGSYARTILSSTPSPLLANCWLWFAQYGPSPSIPPAWTAWTMWQYTDGHHGIITTPVPGIGACDRETFNGDAAALDAFWSAHAVTPA